MPDKLSLSSIFKSKLMPPSSAKRYPPQLSEPQFSILISEVKDWQLNNGSLLKLVQTDNDHTVLSKPIGTSLFPTPFPEFCFDQACALQCLFNKLYAAAACDEVWLEEALKDLIANDDFASVLWRIHKEVKEAGYVQDLTLGLFRSDYMLDSDNDNNKKSRPCIKQVEFNGIACAGGTHSNRISNMHQHLVKTGIYQTETQNTRNFIDPAYLRSCHTVKGLVSGLAAAHEAYGPVTTNAKKTGVLMVVQPFNINVCDERPIEYGLWSHDPPIPLYRVIWGSDVIARTELTNSRALLFYPPQGEPIEVSVAYLRAGLDEEEYDDIGFETRLRLEKSKAIKCPSVLSHITTFKKVQQVLAAPGVLEKFVSVEDAERLTQTFAPMYPLDESEQGLYARDLALKTKTATDYVLKPSLEGGGHNLYGKDIPGFLRSMPPSSWGNYVLMRKIVPPVIHNTLMSPRALYSGPVLSELGIFGTCIWRQKKYDQSQRDTKSQCEIIWNKQEGFSFKTKSENIDEMSVVKGYGCFDSPLLVDFDTFHELCA